MPLGLHIQGLHVIKKPMANVSGGRAICLDSGGSAESANAMRLPRTQPRMAAGNSPRMLCSAAPMLGTVPAKMIANTPAKKETPPLSRQSALHAIDSVLDERNTAAAGRRARTSSVRSGGPRSRVRTMKRS